MSTYIDDDVAGRIAKVADVVAADASNCDRLGRVSDVSEQALRSTEVCKMLQPRDFGGLETHPRRFIEAVIELGTFAPALGWVAGVIGVHPHEVALGTRKLQEEIWGSDPETWIASPYSPQGRARPVDGGYVFNGRWPFSSGTDLCQWVTIGGLVTDAGGAVADPVVKHFALPRPDYEIDHDSWRVMGLRGTGSKDVVVRDAFVPEHRVIDTTDVMAGTAARAAGRQDSPLYSVPRNGLFAAAVTGATLGAARAVLGAYAAVTRERESLGGKSSLDPFQLATLGECSADIDAGVLHVLTDVDRVFDLCAAGEPVPMELRAEVRRNQVRASNRAAEAADKLFKIAGGSSLHTEIPLERAWRDCQAALHHILNNQGPLLHAYGLNFFGHPLPPKARF